MRHASVRAAALGVLVAVSVACGSDLSPSPATPGAKTHAEFVAAACAAFTELDAALGNPDTGSGSDLSKALDNAVSSGDVATTNRLADESIARLEAGRRHLAVAGGWEPGSAMVAATDRFLVVSEALVNGKRTGAATRDGQAGQIAFERAGGLEAWQNMVAAAGQIELPPGSSPTPCPNVPIQL